MQQLPFESLTAFVALGLTLIAGWFLGLASASGGRKWRERYQDEELEHAQYRDHAENDLRESHRRIRDLEAENARLVREAATVAPAPAPAPAPATEGHSTATVAGAAAAGAVAGAVVTHAVDRAHETPADASYGQATPVEAAPAHHDAHAAPAESHQH